MSHAITPASRASHPSKTSRKRALKGQLTELEQRVLDDYRLASDELGRPPSVREQARRLGGISTSTVQWARDGLERAGHQIARLPASRPGFTRIVVTARPRVIEPSRERVAALLEQLSIELAERGESERAGACLLGAEAVRR